MFKTKFRNVDGRLEMSIYKIKHERNHRACQKFYKNVDMNELSDIFLKPNDDSPEGKIVLKSKTFTFDELPELKW